MSIQLGRVPAVVGDSHPSISAEPAFGDFSRCICRPCRQGDARPVITLAAWPT